jgi:hypothetical protein
MPDYIPGQGTLYVKPWTVPVGPFLAYDKEGHLVSTMYMVPIKDLRAHRDFEDLAVAPGMKPQRVQLYYQDAHPGVAEAHYHVVLASQKKRSGGHEQAEESQGAQWGGSPRPNGA